MDFITANYKIRFFGLIITAILVAVLAIPAFSQDLCSLSGTVKDQRTGEPLIGANIIVKGTTIGTASGRNGFYRIANIPAGKQTIVTSYIGYHLAENEVTLKPADAITGKIVDQKTGSPLPGIKIVIQGTSITTTTGSDGSYAIHDMPPGNYVLEIHKEGYKPLESKVSVGLNKLDINLREDIIRGEEVVVTGIASKTAKSVAEVAVSRLPVRGYTNVNNYATASQLMNGKIAGVQVRPASGNVGGGFRFDVRSGGGLNGDEQPVVYLDGVRIENAEILGFEVGGQGIGLLADLNPEEIENIEVLKGPAGAASYGTNGSNGVVLITTKRGKFTPDNSNPLSLNYKIVTGWNQQSYNYSKDDYLSAKDVNDIFRTGTIFQNSFDASGGSDVIRYFASFDSRVEEGILKTNNFDRKNIRANFDVVPNEKLSLNVSSSYTYGSIKRPTNDNSTFGYLINTVINPNPYLFVGGGRSAIDHIFDENKSNRFIGSVSAEYKPVDFFTGRASIGIDDHDFRQDQNYPVSETYSDEIFDSGLRNLYTRKSRLFTYNFDGRFSFNANPNLYLSFMGGLQLFDRQTDIFATQRYDFLTELITTIEAGAEQSVIDESSGQEREAGIFGEASMAYASQYFLSLKIRRDYASRIGKDAASIVYPGASFAWRIDQFRGFPLFFNLLKLRAAYGETGILPRPLDGIKVLFEPESGGYGVGGVPGSVGNEKIRPERVREFEVGLDLAFLDNYAIEFSYYMQKAKDSILEFRRSPSTGLTVTSVPVNIGEIEGSGFETLFHAALVKSRNFDLAFVLINNWQDNEVKDIGGALPIFDVFGLNVFKEGLPKHEFYTEPFLGAAFDRDGTFTGPKSGTKPVALGNPIPNYNGSFSINLRFFRNLNIYAMADWATGHKLWNGNLANVYLAGNSPRYNLLANQLGLAGSADVDGVAEFIKVDNAIPRLLPGTPEYIAAAEEFAGMHPYLDANFIEDADYLKLRELSISYSLKNTFPKFFGSTGYFKDIMVILSAYNLFTWTKYSGPDVEVNWSGARELERGQDLFTLQNPKTYNVAFRFSL